MSVAALLNDLPFVQHMGIEVVEAADGHAVAELELAEEHTTVPSGPVAHGGVAYALADTVGGAAVISLHHRPTPTVDMRIDYHAPATDDLRAEADVVRDGGSVASADVRVESVDGTHVASARGVFKTGGSDDGGPWGAREDRDLE
ncbi:PaaI family thioesterase [Halobaculum sp. MBLA0147]|uniref:PaaI family thioesterase n=1 Tax=Halobaculum sp. MBLA0147 TaxID=3079934 RepID=UPI003524D32C